MPNGKYEIPLTITDKLFNRRQQVFMDVVSNCEST